MCVCVWDERAEDWNRKTDRSGGREDDFLAERHTAGSGLLSPCPMPLECSFVVWAPIRPLFVFREKVDWQSATLALTPEAISSRGNSTFILYDAFCSQPPMFLATNRPWGPPGDTAHPHADSKKLTVNQWSVEVKKRDKPACADTQMAIWMSDFHLGWMHSLTFASKECAMSCKILKTSSVYCWD